jgi:hypothetical protein
VTFMGQPLATPTEVQDYLVEAVNDGSSRRSARQINPGRVRSRSRR